MQTLSPFGLLSCSNKKKISSPSSPTKSKSVMSPHCIQDNLCGEESKVVHIHKVFPTISKWKGKLLEEGSVMKTLPLDTLDDQPKGGVVQDSTEVIPNVVESSLPLTLCILNMKNDLISGLLFK
jgi:hypothetical protein